MMMLLGAWCRVPRARNRRQQARLEGRQPGRSAATGLRRDITMQLLVIEYIVFFLAALGYSQHAKAYCSRQPHSLPPDSRVLKAYPCDGGGARRALYLLRNVFAVYHDMLRLGPSDRWASFQLLLVAVRLGLRFIFPRETYEILVSSFLTQLHRLIPLVYLLAVSYQGIAPSAVGRWYLNTHPALDFLSNVVFPVNPVSECMYGAANMMLVTAIWWRYGHLAASSAGGAAAHAQSTNFCRECLSRGCAISLEPRPGPPGAAAGMVCEAASATTLMATVTVWGGVSAGANVESPYHLGTWLPLQLLMSTACTMATLLLQRWRSAMASPGALREAAAGVPAGQGDALCGRPCAHQQPSCRGDESLLAEDDAKGNGAAASGTSKAAAAAMATKSAGCDSGVVVAEASELTFTPARYNQGDNQGGGGRCGSWGESGGGGDGGGGRSNRGGNARGYEVQRAADAYRPTPSNAAHRHEPPGAQQQPYLTAAAVVATRELHTVASPTDLGAGHHADADVADGRMGCQRGDGVPAGGDGGGYNKGPGSCRNAAVYGAAAFPVVGTGAENLASAAAEQQVLPQGPLGSDTAISIAAAVAAVQSRRPAYVPRVRIMTTHIKVRGAQPEHLESGFTQRLEHVASVAGQQLMGVYVRTGCIELVLDSAGWGDCKSSEGGETSDALAQLQPSGRDSGPLPAPLQPRPAAQPPYWSAPNTPSCLQRQQHQRQALFAQSLMQPLQHHHHHQQQDQQQDQQPLQNQQQQQQDNQQQQQPSGAHLLPPIAPGIGSPPLCGSAGSSASTAARTAGLLGTGPASRGAGSGPGNGYGYGYTYGSGSTGSMQGSGVGVGGGNSSATGDLDLGAVIRALRVNRMDGSVESNNDLASGLDLDLDCGDRPDLGATGLSSGGSDGEVMSSKEGPGGGSGGGSRRGADSLSPAVLGLAATGGAGSANTSLLQQLQQQVLLQQLHNHQQQQQQQEQQLLRQHYLHEGVARPPSLPPLPPPLPSLPAGMAGSISRQALVLGGPIDPMAPGIISLNPRIFVVAAATAVNRPGSSALGGGGGGDGGGSLGGGRRATRFFADVRRVGTHPAMSVMVSSATAADPEFTMRARGEYLALRAVRLPVATRAVAVAASSVPDLSAAAPDAVPTVAGRVLTGGVVFGMQGLFPSREGLQDTRSDMDTYSRRHSEGSGARDVPGVLYMWHESYTLELLEPPQWPGLLLVDLRRGGDRDSSAPAAPRAMPLVAVSDPVAAVELQSVVEQWEDSPTELDDLLLDLGTWLHHATPPPQMVHEAAGPKLDERLAALGRHLLLYSEACGWHATAALLRADLAKYGIVAPEGGNSSRGGSRTQFPSLVLEPPPPPPVAAQAAAPPPPPLGSGQTAPAVPSIAVATAESKKAETGARRQRQLHVGPAAMAAAAGSDVGGVDEGATASHKWVRQLPLPSLLQRLRRRWLLGGGGGVAGSGQGDGVGTPPQPQTPCGAGDSSRSGCPPGLREEEALRQAEQRAFRAFQQVYASHQLWLITLLDVLSLVVLLFRGRQEPLTAPSNVVTLIACSIGAVTAAARLVLPYNRWLYVAEITKVPRHICYCVTKGLIGLGGFPAPPGITAYELGLPGVIFESIIVPWSCLLTVPTAVLVCAAKLPLYIALWRRLVLVALQEAEVAAAAAAGRCPPSSSADVPCLHGPGLALSRGEGGAMLAYLSPIRRVIRALAMAGLFVLVTAACQAHLRVAYERMRARRAAAPEAVTAAAAVAAAADIAGRVGGSSGGSFAAVAAKQKGAKLE